MIAALADLNLATGSNPYKAQDFGLEGFFCGPWQSLSALHVAEGGTCGLVLSGGLRYEELQEALRWKHEPDETLGPGWRVPQTTGHKGM